MTQETVSKMFTMKRHIITLCIALMLPVAALAKVKKPNVNTDQFREKLQDSYNAVSTREPLVTEIEAALLKRIREMMMNNARQAKNMLVDILSEGTPVSAAFNHALGNIYYEAGEFLSAEVEYLAAMDKFPSFQRAWNGLGLTRFRTGDYEGALTALAKSIELGANDSATFGILGYCHLKQGNLKSAEVAYDLAILKDPSNTEWTEGLGQIYMETERYQEARLVFEQLSREYPDDVEYWMLQANTWLSMDEPLKTARCIEIAQLIGKVDSEAMFLLGNIYLKEGVFERAKDVYLATLGGDLDLDESRVLNAMNYLVSRNQFNTARQMMSRMEKPQDTWSRKSKSLYYSIKADVAVADSQIKIAEVSYQLSLEFEPFSGSTLMKLAQLHIESNRSEKALYLLERAEREKSHAFPALMLKAQMMINAKRFSDTLPLLERAIKLRPSEALSDLHTQVKLAVASEAQGS